VITDDDVRIAYQVFGTGSPTVLSQTFPSHVEAVWEFDTTRRYFERLAASLRLVTFDHRGSGLSDGFDTPPNLEDRALDIKAVMDAAGFEKANIIGYDFGSVVALGFAAARPDRVERIALINSRVGPTAKPRADELNPGGAAEGPGAVYEAGAQFMRDMDTVGVEFTEHYTRFSPSFGRFEDDVPALLRFERMIGGRDVFRRQIENRGTLDVVDVAPSVQAPTLVAHLRSNRLIHVGYARLLAELIPNSTLLEMDGNDQMFWLADNWAEVADAQVEFLTGTTATVPLDRRFAVVMFTDIVGSTSESLASGDREWRRRLDTHDRISTRVAERHGGTIVKHTGDGILAVFDMPSRAVAAALELRRALADSGVDIRAGVHAGEIEARGEDISGAVVNLAARVEQAAADGQVWVTRTVRDMLIGSPHRFGPAGSHTLKGFDGTWDLYAVET